MKLKIVKGLRVMIKIVCVANFIITLGALLGLLYEYSISELGIGTFIWLVGVCGFWLLMVAVKEEDKEKGKD